MTARIAELGNPCRHYSPLKGIQSGEDCGIGHPIRDIVIRKCGSDLGLAYKLPCRPGPEKAATCPSYDPRTDDEIAARKDEMSKRMDKIVAGLGKLSEMRKKMIAHRLRTATATCPWCDGKDALRISCAIDYNNHIRAQCGECGEGMIE